MKKEKESKEKSKFLEKMSQTKTIENSDNKTTKSYNNEPIKNTKNGFSFKELMNSENLNSNDKKSNGIVPTYIYRYNVVYSLLYITCVIIVLYIFIVFRDFVQNHLNEQLTNTLNTILKYNIIF